MSNLRAIGARPVKSHRSLRRLVVWAGLALSLPVLVLLVTRGALFIPDFAAYWAGARLNLTGGNPYAPDQILRLEQQVGWPRAEPLQLYNPPWALAVVMPFSLPSYPIGWLLWLTLTLGVTVFCIARCWRLYGGWRRYRALALLVGFAFVPTLMMFLVGQISALLMLGIVGFLHFEREKRWFLAGVLSALTFIKPQMLYLFWLALLLWAVKERRWMTLLSVALACAVATTLAWLPNRAVIGQYLASLVNSSAWAYVPHTLAGLLRLPLGLEQRWAQFVLVPLGLAWLVVHWRRRHRQWDWVEEMPLLLLVSLVTTPYGWQSDQMLLLVAVLQVLAWLQRAGRPSLNVGATLLYATVNLVMLIPWLPYEGDERGLLAYAGLHGSAAMLLGAYLLLRMSLGGGRRMAPRAVEG